MDLSLLGAVHGFHDGSFDGVWVSDDKVVYFFVRTVDGRRFTIVLRGVQRLKLSNLREGNIILDLVDVATEELTSSHIESAYELSDVTRDEQIGKLLASARKEKLRMLQMTPSYGAEGVVLYQSAEMVESNAISVL